jgi:hypothetical protein
MKVIVSMFEILFTDSPLGPVTGGGGGANYHCWPILTFPQGLRGWTRS